MRLLKCQKRIVRTDELESKTAQSQPSVNCTMYRAGRTRREFCPLPCTPHGIVMLLAMHGVRIVGQNAVVIGKSRMVGTPMATMLSNGGATVTQCDIHTDRTTLERTVTGRCFAREQSRQPPKCALV